MSDDTTTYSGVGGQPGGLARLATAAVAAPRLAQRARMLATAAAAARGAQAAIATRTVGHPIIGPGAVPVTPAVLGPSAVPVTPAALGPSAGKFVAPPGVKQENYNTWVATSPHFKPTEANVARWTAEAEAFRARANAEAAESDEAEVNDYDWILKGEKIIRPGGRLPIKSGSLFAAALGLDPSSVLKRTYVTIPFGASKFYGPLDTLKDSMVDSFGYIKSKSGQTYTTRIKGPDQVAQELLERCLNGLTTDKTFDMNNDPLFIKWKEFIYGTDKKTSAIKLINDEIINLKAKANAGDTTVDRKIIQLNLIKDDLLAYNVAMPLLFNRTKAEVNNITDDTLRLELINKLRKDSAVIFELNKYDEAIKLAQNRLSTIKEDLPLLFSSLPPKNIQNAINKGKLIFESLERFFSSNPDATLDTLVKESDLKTENIRSPYYKILTRLNYGRGAHLKANEKKNWEGEHPIPLVNFTDSVKFVFAKLLIRRRELNKKVKGTRSAKEDKELEDINAILTSGKDNLTGSLFIVANLQPGYLAAPSFNKELDFYNRRLLPSLRASNINPATGKEYTEEEREAQYTDAFVKHFEAAPAAAQGKVKNKNNLLALAKTPENIKKARKAVEAAKAGEVALTIVAENARPIFTQMYKLQRSFLAGTGNNIIDLLNKATEILTNKQITEPQRQLNILIGLEIISRWNPEKAKKLVQEEYKNNNIIQYLSQKGGAENYIQKIIDAVQFKFDDFLYSAPQLEQEQIASVVIASASNSTNSSNSSNSASPQVIVFQDPSDMKWPILSAVDIQNIKAATIGLEYMIALDYIENIEPTFHGGGKHFRRKNKTRKTRKLKKHKRYSRKK